MKNYYYIIAAVLLALSFLAGRCTINTKPKVEYIKGDTKWDTIYADKLVPYKIEVPAEPQLPMKPDTIKLKGDIEYRFMKVDTAAIIAEFIKLKGYRKILFDNETEGKLLVGVEIQYNDLQKLNYEFTPMIKQITTQKKKVFTPFVTASYNTFGYYGGGGGLYFKNIGAGYKYITDFDQKGSEFSLHYKF